VPTGASFETFIMKEFVMKKTFMALILMLSLAVFLMAGCQNEPATPAAEEPAAAATEAAPADQAAPPAAEGEAAAQ
jgi:uncharacterized lipoprotein YajG